jgi:hypothetical protein
MVEGFGKKKGEKKSRQSYQYEANGLLYTFGE